MERICENTQEQIAVGGQLSSQQEQHLHACTKCSLLLSEYESLNLLVSDSLSFEVPLGFADSVMSRIEAEETLPQDDWLAGLTRIGEKIMELPQAQYLALGAGGAVSILSLIRFGLFVIIPN
jgi:hypothetical protein